MKVKLVSESFEWQEALMDYVMVENFHVARKHTFLDYIFGGCEINFHIAIDFTIHNQK